MAWSSFFSIFGHFGHKKRGRKEGGEGRGKGFYLILSWRWMEICINSLFFSLFLSGEKERDREGMGGFIYLPLNHSRWNKTRTILNQVEPGSFAWFGMELSMLGPILCQNAKLFWFRGGTIHYEPAGYRRYNKYA